MESFRWGKHFETGLALIDEQHHALVALINRYGRLLTDADGVGSEELQTVFDELTAYTQYHFNAEENLMQAMALDPRHVAEQKRAHGAFLQELTLMQQGIARRQETTQRLLKFLTYWLAYHILGIDQSMAKQIGSIQSGRTPEQAYQDEKVMKEGATEPLLLALNGLFQEVSERNRELRELNRTLEIKVVERTQSLAEANLLLEQMVQTDVLTGLPNRRHAMARLAQAWAQSERDATPLACMMIDADGFKHINDSYGHDAGDEVLRQLATRLRQVVRTNDIVCRLGGDEFLIICPGTALDGAMQAAEATRQAITGLRVPVNDTGEWIGSISVGVAMRNTATQTMDELLKSADDGLYLAKRNGRNRVGCTDALATAPMQS